MSETTVRKPAAPGKPTSKTTLWIILLVAWLGWMFDGMEMGLYSGLMRPALSELLKTKDLAMITHSGAITVALFLLGCSLGGFIFGRLGDKIGRVKTMVITVLMYACFTALSALSHNVWQFGACRFLSAMGLGGEWGLGVALVMETWPNASRPLLAGLLGSASNVGFLISGAVNLVVGTSHWRGIFCIGLAPALLSLPIRMLIKEPERWVKAHAKGERPDLRQLFEPELRRKTILACMISAVAIFGTWGVFQWIPTWVGALVGRNVTTEPAITQMWMAVGQIIGAMIGGLAAEWIGRRISYAIFCVASFISVVLLYSTVKSYGVELFVFAGLAGVFTTSFFGWLPLYLPELFPTRIRATGEGISFNFGRIIAAVAILLGTGRLSDILGFSTAAAVMSSAYVIGLILIWFVPETKGSELPE